MLKLPLVRSARTLLSVIASFGIVDAICRACGLGPQAAIVAAILALGFARGSAHSVRAALTSVAALPVIALVAAGIGTLLVAAPPLGAALYIGAMFVSVWLRNVGPLGRRAGSVIALALIAMLVVPVPIAPAGSGRLIDVAVLVGAGLVSFACVAAVTAIFESARWALPTVEPSPPVERHSPGTMSPHTRMAFQMAVALAAAFVVGFGLFPSHWAWSVITAFIVCSGARGRGDAVYKGVLRLLGAAAGTVVAAVFAHVVAPTGVTAAIVIFVVLFCGLALRDLSYAYWAACITLILALLAGPGPTGPLAVLGPRLAAIVLGALCAVAAAWFVFPIRTEAVVRRRLADALLALDELATHAGTRDGATGKLALFEHRLGELEGVAAPLRWHRRTLGRADAHLEHPAGWIDRASALRGHARTLDRHAGLHERQRSAIRRAIGLSRRAIADHGRRAEATPALTIGSALDALTTTLRTGVAPPASTRGMDAASATPRMTDDASSDNGRGSG